ncbi:hypothetical protein PPERSA_08255 [Pseudocohnilembus persalinus]|uniref:Uncharacterized protein n=1 Tax=Pseudocohnilembus persalinus TaxID=266149 RepID=A0A0V0QG07_PSEPJ|nr:hypothetical protein PPERSA_08255 [Pseudocohnilembus persalinus]|eukprot:KRX01154.1 hypothetical protein PPERSA_08255 [Pseudocohnilembus persalinus]
MKIILSQQEQYLIYYIKIKRYPIQKQQREVRFEKRQQEYLKIIENLKVEIQKKCASRDFKSDESQVQRQQLFNEINDNIDNIQLKISKILVDQEKDITKFFNNKIFEIKKQFEEERIKKGKKEQDYIEKENQLISELEWIKNIAQKIDDENHSLMDQYKKLKSDYQTQENDREMLFKELIMKKKKNAILKSQIEQYQEIYDEVSKEMDPEKDKDIKNESQYHNKSSKINCI